LKKLRDDLGPGAHFEGASLSGRKPIAKWVFFAPRDGLPSVPEDAGLGQNQISANYLLVGALPDRVGFDEALWTIVFPDHALGRLFDRSRPTDPISTMLAVDRNVLKARVADLMPNFFGVPESFMYLLLAVFSFASCSERGSRLGTGPSHVCLCADMA
jgi:hypothetical protein